MMQPEIVIPLSSAVINFINVVILQLTLVPIVTKMTSLVAGFHNFEREKGENRLTLESFDVPVIGGNLIMNRGCLRGILIAVRLSVVIAICISNLGLEGRTRPRIISEDGQVYGPGPIPDTERNISKLENRLVQHLVCNIVEENGRIHKFGLMINGECHREIREHVSIDYMLSDKEELNISMEACETSNRGNRSVRKCDNVDFVCGESATNDETNNVNSSEECIALKYSESGDAAWLCSNASILDESQARLDDCRKIITARQNMHWWIDAVIEYEFRGLIAIFASAYGVSRQEKVEFEEGEEEVTIVTLWWMIPVSWILLLPMVFICYFIRVKFYNLRAIVHDERSLYNLLESKLVVTDGNECLVTYRRVGQKIESSV